MSTGSAQQTSTTTAGVSPFAQNYVDAMLGAGQQQVFNMSPGEGGKMNITGIKPYVPFGAPMDAQGNVSPYQGGQPQGMGWGAYPQRTPGAEPSPAYGGQQGGYGQPQPQAPAYTPTPQQDYGSYGFDQNVVDYLNKQRQDSANDAGIDYTYDPATKTFKGATMVGPVTKTLEQVQQEASGQGKPQAFTPISGTMGGMGGSGMMATLFGGQQSDGSASMVYTPENAQRDAYLRSMNPYQREMQRQTQMAQKQAEQYQQPQYQQPQYQQPNTGYPTGTMQAGMGPGEQLAARSSVAGPSALQQQAYGSAAGMQTPGQYGQATDIGQAAGLGLLNTAGQAQGLQSLAQQAIQQGRQYGQDITDPYRTQAFMSPYMQNVVDIQQREARRASDIAAQAQKGQAVQSGAFGGSRQGVVEAERQRNLSTQLGDIQAQGLQAAFQNAQQQQLNAQNQAMQGYGTGIQGYGQGIQGQTGAYGQAAQGAGTLSNIGGQQLGAQQSIANLQNTFGQQQQQNQQQIINQAMQNYQMQRMYPQQQLQYLGSLLSGLPVSSTGQVTNIPAPSLVSQAAGLGTAGLGTYMLGNKLNIPGFSFKKGGAIKAPAQGGNGLMDVAMNKLGA